MKRTFLMLMMLLAVTTLNAQDPITGHYKKALVIGAHPDDPESMCAGTMLLLKQQGCEVVCVYFTSGEGGIPGKSAEETALIRRQEALNSCEVMGIRPVFMTQVDGNSEINKARYDEMKELIAAEKPDVVFTHWPIDAHRDHRVCSMLVYDAWRQLGHTFDLYYGEVMTGMQTQMFSPTIYVNIDSTVELKRKAYTCHVSQGTAGNVQKWHQVIDVMRGREFQCQHAEAFVKQRWNSSEILDR
ncbi:MAG: PIG-L family deacetylase [Bacteroidales bacterium]|nr:PIG-L family deacetylase [Candidatus Cacconaster merdequi]